MEYFEVFGFESPRLQIDENDLEKRYHKLSLETHPDRVGGSLERSSLINRAYRTLRDPWSRLSYVLKCLNVVESSKLPPSLASLYFEAQEAEDPEAVKDLYLQIKETQSEREARLKDLFSKYDREKPVEVSTISTLQEILFENKYANSMLRDMESKLD